MRGFIAREVSSLRAARSQPRAGPPLWFTCGEQKGSYQLWQVGHGDGTWEEQLGLSWAQLPKRKTGWFVPSSPFPPCCLCWVFSHPLTFGLKPDCATTSRVPPCTRSLPVRQRGQLQNPCFPVCRWACGTVLSLLQFPSVSPPCERCTLLFVCLGVSTETLLYPIFVDFTGSRLFLRAIFSFISFFSFIYVFMSCGVCFSIALH